MEPSSWTSSRHEVVDLLPERSHESLVAWLEKHPGTEIAPRDRSNVYREGLWPKALRGP